MENNEIVQKIENLEKEINTLKLRISQLENASTNETAPQSKDISAEQPSRKRNIPSKSKVTDKLIKEGLENIIGGKLLNRVGILVLLLGIAYFLKYSFDNNWINETGRIIIGLVAGISLLVAGDIAMNKRYIYFSQGLTGGGIAVIYLTVYAGTNYYYIFNPGISFALLALTALAGGILAVRQNAYGVAFLSTLGGFMSPFLIGSNDPRPLPLLSYVVLLDLAVLYLAYYKSWRSLNTISFIGTALVYILYRSSGISSSDVLLNQIFLVIFLVIFGSLAFLYNVRNNKPTEIQDVLLVVLNTAFFLSASLENLHEYDSWHGLFTVFLALLYLLLSLFLQKRKAGDLLLLYAFLGTGLSLVTIAIPLQMDGDWRAVFWLAEAAILFYCGVKARDTWVQRAGLLLLAVTSTIPLLNPVYEAVPVFNLQCLSASLAIAGLFFVFYTFYFNPDLKDRKAAWPAAVYGVILTLKQLSWELSNFYLYYKLGYQDDFAVSLAWLVLALVFLVTGLMKNIEGFRYLSLSLLGLIIGKVLLLDLQNLAIVFRVMLLLLTGVVLVGVSFIYQRKNNKAEENKNV